jgi:hypothetical protein
MTRIEELALQTRQLIGQAGELMQRSQEVMTGLQQVLLALEEIRTGTASSSSAGVVALVPVEPAEVAVPSMPSVPVYEPAVAPQMQVAPRPAEFSEAEIAATHTPVPVAENLPAFVAQTAEVRQAPTSVEETPNEFAWDLNRDSGPTIKTPPRKARSPAAPIASPLVRRPALTMQGTSRRPAEIPPKERRQSSRRAGNIVSVQVRKAAGGEMLSGWILDRSIGGLGLLMDEEVADDTVVFVRPTSAPEDTPWIKAESRYCVAIGSSYRMGCRFVTNPTWQQLRVFG